MFRICGTPIDRIVGATLFFYPCRATDCAHFDNYDPFFFLCSFFFEPFFISTTLMNRTAVQDPLQVLLEQSSQGDKEAFAALYEASHHRLSVYLYRLVREQDLIEDILVETYTEVWKNSSTFKGRSKVLTWMIGIARNIAFKEIRKRNWHDNIDQHDELEGKGLEIDTLERNECMSKAMDALSIKHREILDLAFFQDLSYQEISNLLLIPENTVKTRVYHAKAALKKKLAAMGIHQDDL